MINAFVYGTLRVGEYNYHWASGDVMDEITDVTTKGDLYFVNEQGGYPVAKLNGSGTIIGDILVYEEFSSDWRAICDMEMASGYVLRKITVDTVAGPLDAVAWHYKGTPRGPKIVSGDWIAATKLQKIS